MKIRIAPLALPAGLLLIGGTNVALVGSSAWNRSGPPAATLTLTERELAMPAFRDQENTRLALSLGLANRNPGGWEIISYRMSEKFPPVEYPWLDSEKLRSFGFDLSMKPDDAEAPEFYRAQPSRRVFLAVEMEGEDWSRWIAGRREEVAKVRADAASGTADKKTLADAEALLALDETSRSRLMPLDASVDGVALGRSHPDAARFAVVPGILWVRVQERVGQPARVAGVLELQVSDVEVTASQAPRLQPWLPREAATEYYDRQRKIAEAGWPPPAAPRYKAVVSWGRRLEPWLGDIAPLIEGGS